MLADTRLNLGGLVKMTGYRAGQQNVVGTRLPILEHVEFAVADYSRLATPAWLDILVRRLKDAAEARVRARIAGERVRILDVAVRRITQRVNLFEKILIPDAKKNIQRIRIYLGDAERAAVVTSKLAKTKQMQAGARAHEEAAV
jgi:V/A-type H+-transporting ATPase subunit D